MIAVQTAVAYLTLRFMYNALLKRDFDNFYDSGNDPVFLTKKVDGCTNDGCTNDGHFFSEGWEPPWNPSLRALRLGLGRFTFTRQRDFEPLKR